MAESFEKMFGYTKDSVVMEPGKELSEEDKALLEFIKDSAPKLTVLGTGGSGCNTINRMMQVNMTGAKVYAVNTDAQHLLRIKADKRILIGKNKTRGLGAGSNPAIGEASAQESAEEIKKALEGMDLVFITCGMGGGTGTGSAHVIAKAAKDAGALVIAIVTTPFSSEGPRRMQNAALGLEKLQKVADTTIVIPNDKLLMYVPDLPLNAAFKVADMVLINAVKGVSELITKPGLVNLDFADMRTILENGGQAVIGLGEIQNDETKDRILLAAEKALNSPMLDIDTSSANRVIVNITGGSDMTLSEAESAVSAIAGRVAKDAHIIWGATIDDSMDKHGVRVLAILSGIKSKNPVELTKDREAEIDLEFV